MNVGKTRSDVVQGRELLQSQGTFILLSLSLVVHRGSLDRGRERGYANHDTVIGKTNGNYE